MGDWDVAEIIGDPFLVGKASTTLEGVGPDPELGCFAPPDAPTADGATGSPSELPHCSRGTQVPEGDTPDEEIPPEIQPEDPEERDSDIILVSEVFHPQPQEASEAPAPDTPSAARGRARDDSYSSGPRHLGEGAEYPESAWYPGSSESESE